MELIQQKYDFSLKEPLGGLYEEAEFRNASYLAVRREDGRQVQLVVYSSTKPGQIASYFKKITKFAEVKHPCLTPILECTHDPESNLLFVVLEWSRGYSLKEYLGSNVLHWRTAYNIIRDVLSGLSELHKEGLVYSFMNLENIEIHQGRGRLSFRYFIYKTYYLSPEVKQNHQKSKESDLFSTGVCLFRMIFGTLPFKTKSSGQYTKSVKGGVARKIPIQHACFPHVMPVEMQQYINTLSHFIPAQRGKYVEHHKKLDQMVGRRDLSLPSKELLGQNYTLLSVECSSEQYVSASVIELSRLKHKDQRRIFHLQMIRHNLTEISTYVDDIINPFKNATNLYFANIHDFYVVHKDCLVIVYDYCSQGSLKEYAEMGSFSKEMTEQTSSVLRNLLSQWRGQYRFLTNQYVLVNNGRPVLKYPPFPTKDLKAKLKLSKKGNYFIAPEVQAGIQSITADSWSVGAIEYWMRFNAMPDFNDKGEVIIRDRSQMTAEKCTEMSELLCRKHRERRNLFPLESKPVDRKISSDSYSSSESPRLSSRIKSVPNGNNAIRMNTVLEPNILELQEEIDEFQILTPNYDAKDKNVPKMRKKVQSGVNVMAEDGDGDGVQEEEIEDFGNNPSLKLSKMKEMRSRSKKKIEKDTNGDGEDFNMRQSNHGKKDSIRGEISSSQLNLIDKAQQPSSAKPPINKRFPSFGGGSEQKKPNKRSTIQRDRESTKFRKDSQYQKSQNSRRKTIQSNLGVEPMNMGDGLMGGVAKEAWRVAQIDKHWSKPIRVFFKGLIALIICVFAFYFSFFKINGDLMKSRYDFDTQLLYLRSDSVTTTPTINFTAVTRTPLETYNSLNNQTLTYIRDVERCVTNDYNNNSNVYQIISSGSFGTYQAFGFIIVIINLILLCLSLAKFDLPKALSMTSFDDHFYSPLYNWLLVNLALTSLTSCTYLNYGGLFDLKLDPCLSRSSFPSLTYLMKNEPSSFIWRFVWVYIGIVIAYVLIVYLVVRPKTDIPRYAYVCLILLYIAGVGVRAMGTYNSSLSSIFGACGELLTLFIGVPLLLIDLMVSCRLRKIERSLSPPTEGVRGDELEATEQNFNVE